MKQQVLKWNWVVAWFGLFFLIANTASAAEVAGKVLFGGPGSYILSVAGAKREARRGEPVALGETVGTTGSRLQVAFTDGGMISLMPDTELKITEYHYAGQADGSEKGVFRLVKGGLRTLTGAIGKGSNKDAYRMETPVATIGIRGTEYVVQIGNSIDVNVIQGVLRIWNQAAEVLARAGQSVYVRDLHTAPVVTDFIGALAGAPALSRMQRAAEEAPLTGADDTIYRAGEELNGAGYPVILGHDHMEGMSGDGTQVLSGGQLASGSGYLLAYAGQEIGNDMRYDVDAQFDSMNAASALKAWTTDVGNFSCAGMYDECPAVGTNTYAEWGSTGHLALTRWSGGVTDGNYYNYTPPGSTAGPGQITFDANSGWHTVIGMPATGLPTSGQVTYDLIAGTRPTDGVHAPGELNSASVTVDFGTFMAGANVVATVGDTRYEIASRGLSMPFYTDYAKFYGGTWDNTLTLATSGTGICTGGCSASLYGFLSGAGGAEAGISYAVHGWDPATSTGKVLGGAAVLGKVSAPPAPTGF